MKLAPLLVVAALTGCGKKGFDTATIDVGGHSVKVELAHNSEQRSRGLMFRETMPEERGMLFIYPEQRTLSFWMKDTRIPLSIAFADRTGKIVRIADMTPLDKSAVQSLYPATYALEMNQGWFDRHQVAAGAMITGIPEGLKVE